MPILSSSPSARMAIVYVTAGSLVEAWSLVWCRWLSTHPPSHEIVWFFNYGFILTGLILFCIGLSLGWIGRAARRAELPPSEAAKDVAQAEKNMAARAPVAAANPAVGGYVMGQAVVPGASIAPVATMPATPVIGQPVVNPG